ncbi:acetyltransferase [Dictyobacter vulcani]|uniref:Acetyltransferase n=1 Tax=Dictyobacter vulcani TaxID=2607529 RepID=A0A5J4KLS2_9CHLR|nr:arylamine N-acetyltransferase [Dictyobacter vulcani]GER90658.1 acetyltransferase [Dictyobacter vulcani]
MDVDTYLKRMTYQGSLEPTYETLRALQVAHLMTVPFENLSIHAAQPIVLTEDALYDKVVLRRRGGFCFELNGLFAALLRSLGFNVTIISASMAHDDGTFGPELDHLTLLVHLAEDWLVDVGNGDSFRTPLNIHDPSEHVEGEQVYRLEHTDGRWLLQKRSGDGEWQPEYHFTTRPHELEDFVERCQYYQYSPLSPFITRGRMCSLATPTGRITLHKLRLITTTHGQREEQVLTSEEEYTQILAQSFGMVL